MSHNFFLLGIRAGSQYPVIVHMLQNIADNDVFQHLATEGRQRDRVIVGRVIVLSFLEDRRDIGFHRLTESQSGENC